MSQKPLNQWTGQEMQKLTLDKLESYLWSAADILCSSIDSSDNKHNIKN